MTTQHTNPMQRRVARGLALGITAVCVVMAAAAAADRGAGLLDQALYTATAAAFVIGSHVLPALSTRKPWMWLLSALCLLATLYHLGHFFGAAGERAGAQRATQASAGQGVAQRAAIQAQLDGIKARPLADVAAEQAKATVAEARASAAASRCEVRCTSQQAAVTEAHAKVQALAVERQEAEHRTTLNAQLSTLATQADTATGARRVDPMDAQIAAATGWNVGTVGLLASLVQGLLLEVLGIVAWTVAIPGAQAVEPRQTVAPAQPAAAPSAAQQQATPATPSTSAKTRATFPAVNALPAKGEVRAEPPPAATRPDWRSRAGAWLAAQMTRGTPWSHAAPH